MTYNEKYKYNSMYSSDCFQQWGISNTSYHEVFHKTKGLYTKEYIYILVKLQEMKKFRIPYLFVGKLYFPFHFRELDIRNYHTDINVLLESPKYPHLKGLELFHFGTKLTESDKDRIFIHARENGEIELYFNFDKIEDESATKKRKTSSRVDYK